MALIHCLECKTIISDSALRCPKCAYQLRKLKRGFMGLLFKWSFIIFNVLMFAVIAMLWLYLYYGNADVIVNALLDDQELIDSVWIPIMIGMIGIIGTNTILWSWMPGAIILGLLVLLTEPKSNG